MLALCSMRGMCINRIALTAIGYTTNLPSEQKKPRECGRSPEKVLAGVGALKRHLGDYPYLKVIEVWYNSPIQTKRP